MKRAEPLGLFVYFSFPRESKRKTEENPENKVKVRNDFSTQTRPSQMIRKSCKYILDLALLPRRM